MRINLSKCHKNAHISPKLANFFVLIQSYFGPVYTKTCVELIKLKIDILKSPYLSHFPMLYM